METGAKGSRESTKEQTGAQRNQKTEQRAGKAQGHEKIYNGHKERKLMILAQTENKNRGVSYIDLEIYGTPHCHTKAPLQVCGP